MPASPAPRPTRAFTALLIGVGGAALVALVVIAFLWPSVTATAKNIPLALAGPEAAVSAVEQQLATHAGDLVDVSTVPDRDAAITAVKSQTAHGAIVISNDDGTVGVELLTAPPVGAASTEVVSRVADQVTAGLAQQVAEASNGQAAAPELTTTVVVPLSDADPNGTALTAVAFPLTLGGMLGGILITLAIRGVGRQFIGGIVYAAAAGAAIMAVVHSWFDVVPGNAAVISGVIATAIFATTSFFIACTALIGPAGIGIAATVTMLIGNPLSGATVPWQFLPEPWGAVGQSLIPGAASSLLRSVSYFPAADASRQWLTLGLWIGAGLAIALIGSAAASRRRLRQAK